METKRLLIEPLCIDDKEGYFNTICHDKNVLLTFMSNYQENIEDFDFDRILKIPDLFAIKLKDSKEMIGVILICDRQEEFVEIGYALGSSFWGKGYMTEATKCFIDYLFNERDIKEIRASYFVGNDASKNVMEKCGMKYLKEEKNELEYLGKMRDLIYYVIRRDEDEE